MFMFSYFTLMQWKEPIQPDENAHFLNLKMYGSQCDIKS